MSTIRGIKFPLEFRGGMVVTSTDEQHIKESIIQIIGTGRGEYLLKPDFGSRLSERVFDPVNLSALVGIDIRDAIRKYEPRVSLSGVSANLSNSQIGVVQIIVGFLVKGRSETSNVSFALRS